MASWENIDINLDSSLIEDIEDDDESELGERLILFLVPPSPPCFSPIL